MNDIFFDFIKTLEDLGFEFIGENELLGNGSQKIQYIFDFGEIKVDIDKEQETFDIYCVFTYDDVDRRIYDDFIYFEDGEPSIVFEALYQNLYEDIRKYWITKELSMTFCKIPKEEYDDHYMCPGISIYFGYYNCSIELEASLVQTFIKTCRKCLRTNSYKGLEKALNSVVADYFCENGYNKLGETVFANSMNDIYISCNNSFVEQYFDMTSKRAISNIQRKRIQAV